MSRGSSSEEQPPSSSGEDDYNRRTAFAAQSTFARSLYEIPNQEMSNLLEGRTSNFSQNLDFREENNRSGIDRNNDIFQDLHSFSATSALEQPSENERGRYMLTEYELALYNQYSRKDETTEEDRGNIDVNNTHGSNGNNPNNVNNIADQLNNLHMHNEQSTIANGNHHREDTGTSILSHQGHLANTESHQTLHSTPSIESNHQSSSLDINEQPNHGNKPTIFEGKQQQIFPPPIHLVNPTAIPGVEIRDNPLNYTSKIIEVPECMIAELIDDPSLKSTSRAKAKDDPQKHSITCMNCYTELRVYKLVSLVSCPNCEAVFPNSCFGNTIYMNGNRSNNSVARKYLR